MRIRKINCLGNTKFFAVLERGVLYELRASNPTVDGVTLLKDDREIYWLVFMQVSLQAHEQHRDLCNLFHKPLSKRQPGSTTKPSKSHYPQTVWCKGLKLPHHVVALVT